MSYSDQAYRRTQAYTQQPAKKDQQLTPAQYFAQHQHNLRAVGQSDTRTEEEKQRFSFSFTWFSRWGNLFTVKGTAGQPREFRFAGKNNFETTSDKVAKALGAVTAGTLDVVSDYHRWWNFHFLINWYLNSCHACHRRMQSDDKEMQKVFALLYAALMVAGALATALWAVPRYFSTWQNQREGRKLKNASARFSNIRWRTLWMLPLFALVGAGLASSFGLVTVGAAVGAACGLAFSWGYGIYASKYGVFSRPDEILDRDGKHIPKKSWLKKVSKYSGFENQEVAMYAYAYLTNKMLNQIGNTQKSKDYKESASSIIEYKLRKQFKHGELFDVMRYFQEEHARLKELLSGAGNSSDDAVCKMRTDFDMLTWLLDRTINNIVLTMTVPAYYRQEIRRECRGEAPTQVQFASPWKHPVAEQMRAQVRCADVPSYVELQQNLDGMQRGAIGVTPSAPPEEPPPLEEVFYGGYDPAELPPSYDAVMAENQVELEQQNLYTNAHDVDRSRGFGPYNNFSVSNSGKTLPSSTYKPT